MKALRGMLAVLVLLAFIFTVIPLARAGPTNDQAATEQATVEAMPIVVDSVPPMTTGFDVICNISSAADTSGMSRLSSTVAERSANEAATVRTARSAPHYVMLA